MSSVVSPAFKSLQASASRDCIVILGKPKEGKTTCALSASTKFDVMGKPCTIDDIGVLTFDATGLAYAKALGYDFAYWIDMSDHMDKGLAPMEKMLSAAIKMFKEVALAKKIHTLVVDPVSTLDAFWGAELAKTHEKWALVEQMNLKHKRFLLDELMPIPCNLVLTMHTKRLSAEMDQNKKESLGLDPEDQSVMDIGGWNGPKMYRTQCSAIIPLKKVRGKTVAEDRYYLHPRGVSGIEAGSRYPTLEAVDKMPANIQEVYRLIHSSKVA